MKNLFLLLTAILAFNYSILAQSPYVIQSANKSESKLEEKSIERKFVDDNFPYLPMNKWKEGMRFILYFSESSDKDGFLYQMFPYYKSTKFNSDHIIKDDFKWKIFTFKYSEYRNDGFLYLIFECEGKKYVYFSNFKEREFAAGNDTYIAGLDYVDEIDRAKNLLLGKTLYIMDTNWRDPNNTDRGGVTPEEARQYYPVVIKNIGLSDRTNSQPIKIIFEDESGKEFYKNIKVSNTNNIFCGEINSNRDDIRNMHLFDNVFSFSDPYLKYPHINIETWHKIQNGDVSIGMTEEECSLSWGKPKKINISSPGPNQWVYDFGYLYFENSKLVAFNQ